MKKKFKKSPKTFLLFKEGSHFYPLIVNCKA